jgi:hypothetical protein
MLAHGFTLALLAQAPCPGAPPVPAGTWQQSLSRSAATLDARPDAVRRARRALLAERCGADDCAGAEALVRDAFVGETPDEVCAQATVEEVSLRRFRVELAREQVPQKFRAAAQALVPDGGVVLVGVVEDSGATGGLRAEWAARHLEAALGDAQRLPPPPGWSGREVPPGATALLTGALQPAPHHRVELRWAATFADGTHREAPPFTVSTTVAPAAPAVHAPERAAPGLHLQLDDLGAHHGSLCNGQLTQLHLRVDAARCVTVYEIEGARAVRVFPNPAHPECEVEPGVDVTPSVPEPFPVLGDPGADALEYLVLAAPTAAAMPLPVTGQGLCFLIAGRQVMLRDAPGLERQRLRVRVLPLHAQACPATSLTSADFEQAAENFGELEPCHPP